MHQQINLYQPVFRKQPIVFGAATLMQIAAAVLLLLLVLVGHARWTLGNMQTTARNLQGQVDTLGQQLNGLQNGRGTTDSQALDNEIEQLQGDLAHRNMLLVRFDQLVSRRRSGFAAQFRALAEEHVRGLWLEGVTVNADNRIELRGITLDARLVPLYLQQLERRKDLSPTPFETVSMNRIDPARPQIQFVLRNFKGQPSWN